MTEERQLPPGWRWVRLGEVIPMLLSFWRHLRLQAAQVGRGCHYPTPAATRRGGRLATSRRPVSTGSR